MHSNMDVVCREVGLRDGLQIIDTFFSTDEKINWMRQEAAAGISSIQACSFVPPKLLPQFRDAEQVAAAALEIDGLWVSALVPNLKGAENAAKAKVHEIGFVTSVSESHNMANVRKTTDQSLEEFKRIIELRDSLPEGQRFKLSSGLSTALGCTIEGRVSPKAVMALAEKFVAAGTDELVVADTVGYSGPTEVKNLVSDVVSNFGGEVDVMAHFHDTRGLGLANVFAALEAGCRMFDASLAGLGGCPYAPHATGNVVMEDMIFMLETAGLRTGVDLEKLVAVREIVARNLPNEPLHGMYVKAGPPKGFQQVSKLK